MVIETDPGIASSMGLLGRLAANDVQKTEPTEEPQARLQDDDIYAFTADFYTDHRVILSNLASPEMRLSDHLNGSTQSVDILPIQASHEHSLAHIDLIGTQGSLTKDRILFAIPLAEPARPQRPDNSLWKQTIAVSCWAGIGSYGITGKLHVEPNRDPRIAWKQMDKQFVPLTEATIAFPSGERRECNVVFINRQRLDLLTIRDRYAVQAGS